MSRALLALRATGSINFFYFGVTFMKSTLCTWEDEVCNRQVQFSIGFTNENGTVEINTVTPQKVSFICPTSNTVLRSVGVNTDSGRMLLARKFRASTAFGRLTSAIGNHTNEVSIPHLNSRTDACSA